MTERVDLEVIDYSAGRRNGPIQLFFSVPGEVEESGRKKFREIVQGPSVKAILDEISSDIGVDDNLPKPTHVHGQPIEGDLLRAILGARDRWM